MNRYIKTILEMRLYRRMTSKQVSYDPQEVQEEAKRIIDIIN